MPEKVKNIVFYFLLLSLTGGIFESASSEESPEKKKKPHMILTDSYGCSLIEDGRTTPPGLLDSLFVSFENLEAGKGYSLHVKRSDGKETIRFYKISDRYGEIAEFALWQDMEIKSGEGVIKIDPEFLNYEYSCVLKKEGQPGSIIKKAITILKKKPVIYSSDKDGNPKNIFIKNRDAIYVTGRNIGEKKRFIYLLKDRRYWRKGCMLESYLVKFESKGSNFTLRICKRSGLNNGNYDIIVNDNPFGRIDEDSLIDSYGEAGFRVVNASLQKKEIGRELTCQAPCLLISGNGVELPRPAFKDYFAPVEEVWVALDPHNIWCANKKARLYIINHRELIDRSPLNDVSGGYETLYLKPGPGEFIYKKVWEKPKVREGEYDVVVDLNCNGSYDRGIDIVDTGKKGGFHVPKHWVFLESISFGNPGKTSSYDAIKIDLNESKDNPVNEYRRDWQRGKHAYPAAYITRARVVVYVKIKAERDVFQVRLKAYKRSGRLGDLKSEYIYLKKSGKIGEKIERFQATRYTPRKIRSFCQVWEWYLEKIKLRGKSQRYSRKHIATTMNKIYIILNEPQHPWGIYGERAPWLRVLDIACREAEGAVNPVSAAAKITCYLYSDKKINACYTTESNYSKNNNPASGFRLTDFLNKMRTGVGKVNCYDMGKALVTFSNALGCGLDLMYFKSVNIDPIRLNRVRPVGWDTDRKSPENFENHAFTEMENRIFDASIKVNRSGIKKNFRPIRITGISKGRYLKLLVKKAKITEPEITEFEIEEK